MATWMSRNAAPSVRGGGRFAKYGRIVGMGILKGASTAAGTALFTAVIVWWQSR